MKKLWLFCSLCCYCSLSFGQGTTPPPPSSGSFLTGEEILSHIYNMDMNFYHITQYAEIYTDSIPNDTAFMKQFGRWSQFWSPRVDASGNLDLTYSNMMNVLDNYPVCSGDDADWEQTGPIINVQNSGIITTIASPFGQPNIIYAGSNSGGLWKTENANAGLNTTWENITDYKGVPGLGVNDIIIHPTDPSILYIATGFNNDFIPQNYGSGVWISTDGGVSWDDTDLTWNPLTTTLARDLLAFNKLVFHPTNPNIIFALSDKEIYKMERLVNSNGSTTGWVRTDISYSNRQGGYIDIEFVKRGSNSYDTYVSTSRGGQLLRSLNYGNNWSDITSNIPSPPTAPIPHNGNIINTIVIESAIEDGSNDKNLYVYYLYIDNKGNNNPNDDHYIAPLYKYTPENTLNPWTMLNNGLNDGQGGTNDGIDSPGRNWIQPEQTFNNFEVNPKDANIMYFPGQKLGKTNNEGIDIDIIEGNLDWVNSVIHGDHRDVIINFLPNNTYEIVVGNDGGVSTAIPNTTTNYTYTNINGEGEVNDRLILSQCTDISISNNIAGVDKVILGGAIDNANYLKSNSNFLWENIGNVDGGQTAINETYGLAYIRVNGRLYVYDINSSTYKDSEPLVGNSYLDLAEIVIDKANPNYFYTGKKYSFKKREISSTNYNIIGTQINLDFTNLFPQYDIDAWNCNMSCFAQASSNTDKMYLAFSGIHNQTLRRVFTSDNGGVSWDPLPAISINVNDGGNQVAANPLWYKYITDIAINPEHDRELWASISSWSQYGNTLRVIHSTDGGDTWEDFSEGLTSAPVNAIIYQEGSEGVLFAATDVGVYRYNPEEGIKRWECFNQGFPVSLVNDLEISTCENRIYASAYGRGIWDSELPPLDRNPISENTTWQNIDRNVSASIVVRTGIQLIIKNCTVNMSRGTSIIVEPGASLVIDGATLTNTCGEMWDGIIVQGDATAPQIGTFPSLAQGLLTTRNDAQIEYALDAIRVWDPIDGGSIDKSGGVVKASRTTFLNNRRDVEFMKYDSRNENLSSFITCEFRLDNDYRGTLDDLDDRVTMWHVNGVKFAGCLFEINNTDLENNHARSGIYSIDAGYDVGASCDISVLPPNPCPEPIRSQFKNFYYGVRASATNNNTIRVNKTDFDENVYGVSIDAMNNAQVTECTFFVGNGSSFDIGNVLNIGIFVGTGIGYEIQENSFTGTGDYDLPNSVGVYILNTESHENKVYKNYFEGLFAANLAVGDNGGSSNANNPGLQYQCNTQSSNNADIYVLEGDGIKHIQGTPANPLIFGSKPIPDGNNFSNTNNSIFTDYNYRLEAASNPVYRYIKTVNGNTPSAIYRSPAVNEVNPPSSLDNDCLSELNELDEVTILAGKAGQINNYTVYEAAYNTTAYLYDNLMDGGDAQALSNDIEFEWADDAWEMRTELLAESPNLSEAVLLDAAYTGTLPDALLMEVLLANPRSVRSTEFHEVLLNEIPNPLPQYMVNLLPFAAETPSVRANLEEQMVVYNEKKANAVQLLIGFALRDSIVKLDTVKYWLERDNTPKGRFALAEHYLSRGQYVTAQNVLNNVAIEFEDYTERKGTTYQAYQQLMTLKVSILQNGRTWIDITEGERGELQTIAYGSSGNAAFQARGILCFFFDECIEEIVDLTNPSSSAKITPVKDAMLELTQSLTDLKVYPNPATDYVNFDYKLPEYVEKSTVIITSITGQVVKEFEINNIEGQVLWDTRNTENGIYFYALKQGDKTLVSGKVSIMK